MNEKSEEITEKLGILQQANKVDVQFAIARLTESRRRCATAVPTRGMFSMMRIARRQ